MADRQLELFNLFGLFCMVAVCEESHEVETKPPIPSLVDKAKAFLQDDPITLQIVEMFYELDFRGLMHFSLNHLLVSRELFAHNSYNLAKSPDFNQLELDVTMNALDTSEKKDGVSTD